MIESFSARGFRAFEALELTGLKSVNILVGRSASGKTALLEAVRLALGATPTVAWQLNSIRGMAFGVPMNPSREQFEAPWGSYFHEFNIETPISLAVTDSEGKRASLKLYFDSTKPVTPTLPVHPSIPIGYTTIVPLAFERKLFTGEESTLYATINQQGSLQLDQGAEVGLSQEFFPSTAQSNSSQVANWFSQLSIRNTSDEIIDIMRKQFDEITDIRVELGSIQVPTLYATLKHRSRKFPLSIISSGINKFASLIIAIKEHKPGVILIDEIENGIYFKMFPDLWRSIHSLAKQCDAQLFVSTHSWECLKAVAPIIDLHPEDFSLLQLYQDEGKSKVTVVPGYNASAAIENDVEVRR